MKATALTIAAILSLIAAPTASADKKAEAFVETQANGVLKVLNDKALTADERSEKFSDYMHKFAYLPDIARRVLGAEGRNLSQADFDRYYHAFEDYATAVYETQLDEFRGQSIKVIGSTDPAPRRSEVSTMIKSTQTGEDNQVIWDVLQSQDGQSYRVRDVGINVDGSVIWLAQDQQAQFGAILDRNHDDIDDLISRIDKLIADMGYHRKSPPGSAPAAGKKPG